MSLPGPTSHSYFSQRLRMHYVDWGNPEAPPLILLHGGRDHCRNWDWIATDFRDDYHVICPDLRGHGDSAWCAAGQYTMANYIYDLAQLIHQLRLPPVSIIAHSLGGNVAVRYAGILPDTVSRLVAIEGLGPGPGMGKPRPPIDECMRSWIDKTRANAGRNHRRYPSLDAARARMREANKHLSDEQVSHLTEHGVNQNEDGTYSWKFDPYVRVWPPYDMTREEIAALWSKVTAPTLLVYGKESWARDPAEDGRMQYFRNARVLGVADAGHWVHHDQRRFFTDEVRRFLHGG